MTGSEKAPGGRPLPPLRPSGVTLLDGREFKGELTGRRVRLAFEGERRGARGIIIPWLSAISVNLHFILEQEFMFRMVDDQHRAARGADDLFRYAAHQQAKRMPPPVSAHDNQVDVLGFSVPDDLIERFV